MSAVSRLLGPCALSALALGPPDVEGRYVVRYDPAEPRLVRVEAELPARSRRLSIGAGHPHPPDRRYGDYVEVLAVRTPDGRAVETVRDGRDQWLLRGPAAERVHVSYVLRVGHDAAGWPPSHAEAAYGREDGVFLRSWALFLVADGQDGARVRLELAPGAQAFASWDAAPDDPTVRVVGSPHDFEHGALFLGAPQHARFESGGVDVELVVTHDLPGAHDRMRAPLARALEAATDYFGRPASGRYAVFASRAPHPVSSGSGFPNGMSMVLGRSPVDEPDGDWLHTLVHELVHSWNGVALRRKGPEEEWFNEGFTDYVALHLAAREELSSAAWRGRYFARQWGRYLAGVGGEPLTTAGRRKGDNYGLVYGGGMVSGLLLDLWIRADSNGERNLSDLFRALLPAHGPDRPFDTADVQRAAQALVERDLGPFFDAHVRGAAPIDAASFLAPLGLVLGEVERDGGPVPELRVAPGAGPEARGLARELLGID